MTLPKPILVYSGNLSIFWDQGVVKSYANEKEVMIEGLPSTCAPLEAVKKLFAEHAVEQKGNRYFIKPSLKGGGCVPSRPQPRGGSLTAMEAQTAELANEHLTPPPPATTSSRWHVPQRNSDFTGREETIADITKRLDTGKTGTDLTQVVLSGLGGIGKTSTVIECLYRVGPQYSLVWMIGEDRIGGFRELGKSLNLRKTSVISRVLCG